MSLLSVCSRRRAINWAVTRGANPRLGSSSSSRRGREMRARPSTSIWRSPPESMEACRRRNGRRRGKRSRISSTAAWAVAPGQAPEGGQAQVLVDGQLLYHPPPLGHVGDAEPRHGLHAAAHQGGAVEAHRAADRFHQPRDRAQQSGLAGPIGPQDGRHRARLGLEGDRTQRLHRPEGDAEVPDLKHRVPPAHGVTPSSLTGSPR